MIKTARIAAISLLLVGGVALEASAATQQAAPTAAQSVKAAKTSISDQQIKQFVSVQKDFARIRQKYQGKLKATKSKQEARQIQSAAQKEMIQAINHKGMTVAQYNQIATAYRTDPTVRKRVESQFKM